MDCITFTKIIDRYLSDGLTDEELNSFLIHLSECDSCEEELEVHYIVREGIRLLELDHADYDLSAGFRREVSAAKRRMAARKLMIRLSYIFNTITFWAVLSAVFVYLRLSFL